MSSARDWFNRHTVEWSDIQAHLPTLRVLAKGNVLELGVRKGVSTSALLVGVEENGGHVWSVDIDPTCEENFKGHPHWTFICGDSLILSPLEPPSLDLLFVDTLHTKDHVLKELEKWGPLVKPGGVILVHDAITFPEVWEAILEFCKPRGLEPLLRAGSNGLGMICIPQ